MFRRLISPIRGRGLIALSLALFALPISAQMKIGTLDFQRCEMGEGLAAVKASCAYLNVPENHDTGKGTVKLHIGVLSSTAKKPTLDPAVFIAGGPGQAGSESIGNIRHAFAEILKTRHVIVIDQRGTGKSLKLSCEWDEVENFDVDDAALDALMKEAAVRCRRQWDASPEKPDLAQFTTTAAVRDMDLVRIALGAPQLNLVGFSYGTRVAQQYAKRYPTQTRSVIIDGIAPNNIAFGADMARVLDQALALNFARCSQDKACSARFGDSAVALKSLQANWAVRAAIKIPDPRTGLLIDAQASLPSLQTVARIFAYSSEYAAMLPLLLDEAVKGRPMPLLAQTHMASESFASSISFGMQLSVVCTEDAPVFKADPQDSQRLLGTGFGKLYSQQCPEWPKGDRPKDFAEPLTGELPALLVSGALDPVTPPEYGDAVLKTLSNAVHIVVQDQGHGNLGRGCLPKIAAQFIESLDAKKLDLTCVKKIKPAPFFLEFTGAAP